MKRFIIERNIPGAGSLTQQQIDSVTKESNSVLESMKGNILWESSVISEDKIYCFYLADNIDLIKKHAELSNLPADQINEIKGEKFSGIVSKLA